MQIKIFTIPFTPRLGGFDDEPLRAFLSDKQVHSIESWHFVHEGLPYWSVLTNYTVREALPTTGVARDKAAGKAGESWRKQLTERDWPVFNALREWRSARAQIEGIPAYLVFTNEQLTRFVLERVGSLSALVRIAGVGPSRVEKYGKDVLRILDERREGNEERRAGASGLDVVAGIHGMAAGDDGEVSPEAPADADEPDRQLGTGRGDDVD